jgi:hypothetical protein
MIDTPTSNQKKAMYKWVSPIFARIKTAFIKQWPGGHRWPVEATLTSARGHYG